MVDNGICENLYLLFKAAALRTLSVFFLLQKFVDMKNDSLVTFKKNRVFEY